MFQTGYKQLLPLGKLSVPYIGGFCKWWYTPIENIATWPVIDPATQKLIAEPALHAGATWFGPVEIPTGKVGFEEKQERTPAGIFYKQKVSGVIYGSQADNHINLENLAYYQLCIVAKLRSGGFFIILGDNEKGFGLDQDATSGLGPNETPDTKITLTGESIHKANILKGFSATNVSGLHDYPAETTTNSHIMMETIYFTNTSLVNISYTPARRTNFGDFPLIEVWVLDPASGLHNMHTADIEVDAPAPNQTMFTMRIAGPASGFIILK